MLLLFDVFWRCVDLESNVGAQTPTKPCVDADDLAVVFGVHLGRLFPVEQKDNGSREALVCIDIVMMYKSPT